MPPLRVVLVGPYPMDPERVEGGVETAFMTLVSELARLPDLEPHAVAFSSGLRRPIHMEVDGIRVDFLPRIRRLGSLTFHVLERRALTRLLSSLRPDLVHAQDATRHGYVSLKAARRIPVVVSVHGISREEAKFARDPIGRLRFARAGALEQFCVRHARYLTQPTRYPEQYFGSELRGRIWDVGNPIADEFFSLDPTPESGRILYSGAVIPRKRLVDLVEAMPQIRSAIPDATLHVVGAEMASGYARSVRARVADLGLNPRVVFVGPRPPKEMVDEYRRASVLVLPSAQETSPMTIGEAMASSVPVVATRVGGVPYLVDEGITGHVVAVGDVPALAERVVGILRDPEHAAALGAAGRRKADPRFRVHAVAGRVRAVYDEALRGR